MKCPDQLLLSIYADGELEASAAAEVEGHLDGCGECCALAQALRAETGALREAFAAWPEDAARSLVAGTPARVPAVLAAGFAILAVVGWLVSIGWSMGRSLVPAWLDPLSAEGGINLVFNGGFFLARIGGELMTVTTTWSMAVATASLVILSITVLKTLPGDRLIASDRLRVLALVLVACLATPLLATPAAAVEFRSASTVTIDESASLDETLFATGEVVRIDGRIDGDLVAFARQVTINGIVTGSVLAGGQNIDVNGEVGGTLAGFGQWVRVGASVDGNLYAFGQTVTQLEGGAIDRDGFIGGELLETGGSFGRDLHAAGRKLTISGRIERDLQVEAESVEISPSGHVGGSVDATLPHGKGLSLAEGAVVAGETKVSHPIAVARKSRYTKSGFYVWGLIKLAGAFVVGALLTWLVPSLFGREIGSMGAGLGRVGIGLLVLVATPVAVLVTAITLVGLPLALLTALSFLAALYLSKIFVADWIGRRLTGSDGSRPKVFLALLAGLAIVAVAGALPWIGGWIKFAILLLGLGMSSMRLFELGRASAG